MRARIPYPLLLPLSFVIIVVFFGPGASTALAKGEGGGGNPPVQTMRALFDHDGLLDLILQRIYEAGRPVVRPYRPFPTQGGGEGGDGSGPDPDGVPYATVLRATIDGPAFRGYYREGLNRTPDFCVTPNAPPIRKESRITLEIWTPDPLDFSDLDSAVVLVQKSIVPDGINPTTPQLIADQLAQWGISTVLWWERDDLPAAGTIPNLDVVVANRTGDSYAFFLGTGALPEPPIVTPVPQDTFPHEVIADDFDADGNLDLAIAYDGTDTVSVRLGDGYGLFKNNTDFSVGTFPRALDSGSVNNGTDGHLDLVVANRNSDNITVMLGDGTGDFPTITSVAVGVQPSDVIIEDFDGDSRPDVVVSNGGDNNVMFLKGDGSGGFSAPVAFPTDQNPFAMVVGDLNNDLKLDLVTANRDTNNVSVLLGNGDGTFQPPLNTPVGTDPTDIIVGFLNGDLNLDVAVSNSLTNNVTVLRGNGAGGFAAPTTVPAGTFPNALDAGDLDGNGTLDLIVGNRDSGDVSVLLGNGTGNFLQAPGSPFVVDDGPSGIVVGNFTDATLKLAYQFGYSGDGAVQEAGFGWMVHRRLNKNPGASLTGEELRFDLRFAYAQAYLISTTFFTELLKFQFPSDPNLEDWLDELKINYAGGSKRGGGISTAVMQSNILAGVDPRNVTGLFISGYEGLDAGELSGLHRYESDWTHTFDPDEIEVWRDQPCPVEACLQGPCPSVDCPEDSGEHVFRTFAAWAHRMRDEPQSYAQVYTPSQNPANLLLLQNVLLINTVGTHDWINPLGSHRNFYEENPGLDSITLQRINKNHGSLVELGDWSAKDILHMRALYGMRNASNPPALDTYPLHRVKWVDLQMGSPDWTATIELETNHSGSFPEDYTVWVAFSDDRDFRRNADPIESRPQTPCIDSDPNTVGDSEDYFIAVTPTSVVPSGNQRILTFQPPAEYSDFTDPLISVIVEGYFEGFDAGDTVDDLIVTTWPKFLNEDLYPGSISDCQGKDGLNLVSVNGQTGAGQEWTVVADSTGPLQFSIVKPPAGGNGKFFAQLDAGLPTNSTITKLTNQLGDTCFPVLLNNGAAPVARFNGIGKKDKVGCSEYFGDDTVADPANAPTTFLDLPTGDAGNLPIGTVFTLHAVIINPAVVGAKQASITNSVIVTIN